MKILVINSILYTSETNEISKVKSIKDTMIYTMCLGFLALGHTPVLIAAEDYRPIQKEQYPFEIIFLKCRLKKFFPPRCLPWMPSLKNYLRKNQGNFDLIISSEVFSLCSFTAVRTAKKKTVIWHELGRHNNIFAKIPSEFWYNVVARLFFRNVLIIPRSKSAYEFISKYCNKVSRTYIDHGVDLRLFQPCSEKEKRFVVISRLIEQKRIDITIDKFSDFIRKYGTDAQLYIIGDGILKDRLKKQVEGLGIESSVVFTGQLPHTDMVSILSRSQAMLVNTEQDANMVTIAESIACGIPVLTNAVPFSSFYIQKNSLGIVKDNWGCEELNEILENNSYYTRRCIAYREKLGNTYCANQFIQMLNLA